MNEKLFRPQFDTLKLADKLWLIIGNGEFRASSGKVDGFILYADTLQ